MQEMLFEKWIKFEWECFASFFEKLIKFYLEFIASFFPLLVVILWQKWKGNWKRGSERDLELISNTTKDSTDPPSVHFHTQ